MKKRKRRNNLALLRLLAGRIDIHGKFLPLPYTPTQITIPEVMLFCRISKSTAYSRISHLHKEELIVKVKEGNKLFIEISEKGDKLPNLSDSHRDYPDVSNAIKPIRNV